MVGFISLRPTVTRAAMKQTALLASALGAVALAGLLGFEGEFAADVFGFVAGLHGVVSWWVGLSVKLIYSLGLGCLLMLSVTMPTRTLTSSL